MDTITCERARSILSYDPETGDLRWRIDRKRAKAGTVATRAAVRGYLKVKVERRYYQAHRLAWLIQTGAWPCNQIDHINGVRDDNRIVNLRDVTCAENARNRRGKFAANDESKARA